MSLTPLAGSPGRWSVPERNPDEGGLYALIVGASSYPHLAGGADPAAKTFDLQQLPGAARTAAELATWLRDEYADGPPLVRLWLHLAPGAGEALPPGWQGAATAEWAALEAAILEWAGALAALSPEVAAKSAALFYFAGHGVEFGPDEQLLLPASWPSPIRSRAISVRNLRDHLSGLAVATQWFFLDACRSGSEELQTAVAGGTPLLDAPDLDAELPVVDQPVLSATSRGRPAYVLLDRGTAFGLGLLEGLRGTEDITLSPRPDGVGHEVRLAALQDYLNRRVKELLPPDVPAGRITLGGSVSSSSLLLTSVPGPRPRPPDLPQPLPLSMGPAPVLPRVRVPEVHGYRLAGPKPDWSLAHHAFGHELLTDPWTRARLDRRVGSAWEPVDFRLLDLDRDLDAHETTAVLVPEAAARLYRFRLGPFVALLPQVQPARYVLRTTADRSGFQSFEAALDPTSPGRIGELAQAWARFRDESPTHGCDALPDALLEATLAGKVHDPVAAAVAAAMLARGGRWERLHDWLRNLCQIASWLPDGAALWAWQQAIDPRELGGAPRGGRADAVRATLRQLRTRGLPWTTEGLRLAEEALRRVHRPGRGGDSELDELGAALERALCRVEPSSLFTTLELRPNEAADPLIALTSA